MIVTAGGANSSAPQTVTGSNESIIHNYLLKMGLSQVQAAGVLGNWQVESGFDNHAYNPREGAHGFAQWENGRWTSLQRYASAHNLNPTSVDAELGYFATEIHGGYSGTWAQLKQQTTPEGAAMVFSRGFEGNTPASYGQRQSAAASIYRDIMGGKTLNGGPTSSSSAQASNAGGGTAGGAGAQGAVSIPGWLGKAAGGVASAAGGVANSVGGGIASGVEAVITDVAAPIEHFLINAACIIVGVVMVVISAKTLTGIETSSGPEAGTSKPKAAGAVGALEANPELLAAA